MHYFKFDNALHWLAFVYAPSSLVHDGNLWLLVGVAVRSHRRWLGHRGGFSQASAH